MQAEAAGRPPKPDSAIFRSLWAESPRGSGLDMWKQQLQTAYTAVNEDLYPGGVSHTNCEVHRHTHGACRSDTNLLKVAPCRFGREISGGLVCHKVFAKRRFMPVTTTITVSKHALPVGLYTQTGSDHCRLLS